MAREFVELKAPTQRADGFGWFKYGLLLLVSWTLRCRYRITTEGLEKIVQAHGPFLFLFEHVAQVDFALMGTALVSKWTQENGAWLFPLFIGELQFAKPGLVLDFVRSCALPVPANRFGRNASLQIEQTLREAVNQLKKGRSVALSPVGHLVRADGFTILKAQFGAAYILGEIQSGQATIVTVHFDGLFGSAFSRALTDQPPSYEILRLAIKAFLKGGFLLSRRRPVRICFQIRDLPIGKGAQPETVNPLLQKIFCQRQRPTYIPYHLFDPRGLDDLVKSAAKSGSLD